MADTVQTDDGTADGVDAVNTGAETEPATNHDVAEGGILGAVGGAVVGALAGGPIGAVIGAIVGGVVSAGAVDAVDKHDHDAASQSVPLMSPVGMAEPALFLPSTDAVEQVPFAGAFEAVTPAGTGGTITPVDTSEPVPLDMNVPMSSVSTPEDWDLNSEIRERAYALYEQRGRGDGQDVQDWITAEREVMEG